MDMRLIRQGLETDETERRTVRTVRLSMFINHVRARGYPSCGHEGLKMRLIRKGLEPDSMEGETERSTEGVFIECVRGRECPNYGHELLTEGLETGSLEGERRTYGLFIERLRGKGCPSWT